MTTAAPDYPRSAGEILFGPSADAPEALTRHILSAGGDVRPALKRLSRATREAAVREATAAAAGLLKVDLLGVLLSGWRDHKEINAAAHRTLAMLSSRELVSLPPHRIATRQQPSVSILVDGKRVAFLRLGLSIIFDVEALVAGISSGKLSAVHAGRCSVGVALTVHDVEALTKRAHLELPSVFRLGLGHGLRLLPRGEYPPGVSPGSESPDSTGPARLADAVLPQSHFPAAALDGPATSLDDQDHLVTSHPDSAAGAAALSLDDEEASPSGRPVPAQHTMSDAGTTHPSADATHPSADATRASAGGARPWWENVRDTGK